VLVQMNRNHVHVSIKKVLSIIFQEENLLKNEIFFMSNGVCSNVRSLFLYAFCIRNQSFVVNDEDMQCFSAQEHAFNE
jgi:hypothetical protein